MGPASPLFSADAMAQYLTLATRKMIPLRMSATTIYATLYPMAAVHPSQVS